MTAAREPRVRRPGRRGTRGQSLVMVALAGVALIGMTGLALDSGYEAGVYRDAQNGADAGALAAARTIYENQANPSYLGSLCTLPKATAGVAAKQVYLNNSSATPTCTAKTLTTQQPAGPDGYHSYGALATVDTGVNVGGLANLNAHIGVNEATADVTANPTPSASGSVDIASLSASLTAIVGLLSTSGSATLFGCSSSASGAGNSQIVPSAGGSCPGNSLALSLALQLAAIWPLPPVTLNVDVLGQLGLTGDIPLGPGTITLIKQALSSRVPTSGTAQQRDFTRIAGATLGLPGAVSLNANAGTTTSTTGNLGGNATGVDTSVNIADLSATIAGIGFLVDAFNARARVSYDPVNGFQATTSCSLLSGEGTAQLMVAGVTVGINADCSYTPIGIPNVLTVSSTKSVNCQTGPNGQLCTASVCVLDVNVLSLLSGVASIHVCLGKASASADFKPVTNTGGVIVTSQIPSPTFFLGVVGAHSTTPTATAGATPRQVTDVAADVFAAAPYAVPYQATEKSVVGYGQNYCNGSFGPLLPGCNYTVWGPGVDGNTAMEKQLAQLHCVSTAGNPCWQGQLNATSNHATGQTATAAAHAGTGPTPVISGARRYLLLPVINDDGSVRQFGLFLATSNDNIFTLARTPDPVNSVLAPLAQSETTGGWMPNDEGAVATKLVDPGYFSAATGWS